MPSEKFQLTYAGETVNGGAMSVYELAPALIAVGDLIKDANRLFNGDRSSIDLSVQADFKKSSFEIDLLLNQQMLQSAYGTFEFLAAVDAKVLLDQLFGVAMEHSDKVIGGAVVGMIAIYKLLKGEKPKSESVTIKDNHGTINIDNRQITVDAKSIQLYMNDPVRADLDRFALPVTKEGIERVKISKDGNLLGELTKGDLPPRLSAPENQQEATEHSITSDREAFVKVVTAGFEDNKWKFSDGSSKFNATIADPVFQEKLDNHQEGFYKGDVLRVVLKSTQTEKANGKIQTQYTIRKVIEHRRASSQTPLFPTSPKNK
jgi:hypothetical protein